MTTAAFGRLFRESNMTIEDENLSGIEPATDGAPAEQENDSTEPTEEESEGSETETEDEGEQDDAEAEDGESDEDKSEGDDEAEDEPPSKPKRESRAARYQRQIDRVKAENAELRSRVGGSLSGDDLASRVEKTIGKPPNEADFKGDFIAYERAMNAYEVDKRFTAREIQKQGERDQAHAAERRAELAEEHLDRIEEFRTKAKDFDTVMKGAANLKASPTVEELVLESDKSAHVVYYLAKNPDQLEKLNAMTERQAARAIGQIESRLSLPQPKTQTLARKPVVPLKGGAAPSSPDKELDAWLAKKYPSKPAAKV